MNKFTTLIAFLIAWSCWLWVVGCVALAILFILPSDNDTTTTGMLFLIMALPGLIGHEINRRFVKPSSGDTS